MCLLLLPSTTREIYNGPGSGVKRKIPSSLSIRQFSNEIVPNLLSPPPITIGSATAPIGSRLGALFSRPGTMLQSVNPLNSSRNLLDPGQEAVGTARDPMGSAAERVERPPDALETGGAWPGSSQGAPRERRSRRRVSRERLREPSHAWRRNDPRRKVTEVQGAYSAFA